MNRVYAAAAGLCVLVGCGARTGDVVFVDPVLGDASVHDVGAGDASVEVGAGCPPVEPVAGTACTLDVMAVCNWSNGCGAFDTGWCEGGRWSMVSPGCTTTVDAGPTWDAASCANGAPCSIGETCRLGCWRGCRCDAGSGTFVCLEYPC